VDNVPVSTGGVPVGNALEAAEALMAALGITYGEITVQVREGRVRVVRRLETIEREGLSAMKVPGVQSP